MRWGGADAVGTRRRRGPGAGAGRCCIAATRRRARGDGQSACDVGYGGRVRRTYSDRVRRTGVRGPGTGLGRPASPMLGCPGCRRWLTGPPRPARQTGELPLGGHRRRNDLNEEESRAGVEELWAQVSTTASVVPPPTDLRLEILLARTASFGILPLVQAAFACIESLLWPACHRAMDFTRFRPTALSRVGLGLQPVDAERPDMRRGLPRMGATRRRRRSGVDRCRRLVDLRRHRDGRDDSSCDCSRLWTSGQAHRLADPRGRLCRGVAHRGLRALLRIPQQCSKVGAADDRRDCPRASDVGP